MATLTGKTPKDTYKDLLQVSNANSGVDATLRAVEDGEGTTSALSVSTVRAAVAGTLDADSIITHSVDSQPLATPGAPTVTPQGTGGGTTWTYRFAAVTGPDGKESDAGATGTTAVGNATLNGTNFNRLTWTAVTGAYGYNVYRTVAGGTPNTTGKINSSIVVGTTFDDTGLAGDGSLKHLLVDFSGMVGGVGLARFPAVGVFPKGVVPSLSENPAVGWYDDDYNRWFGVVSGGNLQTAIQAYTFENLHTASPTAAASGVAGSQFSCGFSAINDQSANACIGFSNVFTTWAGVMLDANQQIHADTVTITDNVATDILDIALAAGQMIGGKLVYTITATDGTDHQSKSGSCTFSAVNKAGTITCAIGEAETPTDALSGGTLDDTWAIADTTNKVTIRLTSNTSLTPTAMSVRYTLTLHGSNVITKKT